MVVLMINDINGDGDDNVDLHKRMFSNVENDE